MKRKEKKTSITSSITSEVKSARNRKTREGLTRVGVITSPIKGKDTNARQWNRWTP